MRRSCGRYPALRTRTNSFSLNECSMAGSTAILATLITSTIIRTSKYLNNIIEQDHRRVKQRCYPMLWFKTFGNAEVTLSGIELANKIKKGQFDTSEITNPGGT